VINSRNVSLGQGLLAVFAAECAEAGLDIETTLAALERSARATSTFALLNDLAYAVRGGRVPACIKTVANLFRVMPVLRTTADGEIKVRGVLAGRRNRLRSFARFIARRVPKDRELRFSIGHAMCREQADDLAFLLRRQLPLVSDSGITNLGSAVGVHGGPGTLVVGIQEYFNPKTFRQK
jgi:DegV family protein with EDD domain